MRIGCLVTPVILGIGCIATGAWLLASWSTLSTFARAGAILVVVLGTLLLLPPVLWLGIQYLFFRLQSRLHQQLGSVGDAFKNLADDTQQLYETPASYRAATPEDFAGLDQSFYDESQRAMGAHGFRRLGDVVNEAIEKIKNIHVPMRLLAAPNGSSTFACYHVAMEGVSVKLAEFETEFSDGTFLVTANSEGFDLSTLPAQITRQQHANDTPLETLRASHISQTSSILANHAGLQVRAMTTLQEITESQGRIQQIKNAARKEQGYLDPDEIRRVAEADAKAKGQAAPEIDPEFDREMAQRMADLQHRVAGTKAGAPPGEGFFAWLRRTQREAAEKRAHRPKRESMFEVLQRAKEDHAQREAEKAARRGPDFLKGSGTALPCIRFDAPPEGAIDYEDKPYVGLGGMIKAIEKAKLERDLKELAKLALGVSRFGGLPDLPPEIPWPTYRGKKIPFLAQVDLAALPPVPENPLPRDGWLYAFSLQDNVEEHRPNPTVVLLHRGPRDGLVRATLPPDDDIWPDWTDVRVYAVVPLLARPEEDDRHERLRSKQRDAMDSAVRTRDAGHMFGNPDDLDANGSAGHIAEVRDRSGDDWINLLTLNSVGSMQWSDAGYFNIIIRKSDLARLEFSNICAAIWSS